MIKRNIIIMCILMMLIAIMFIPYNTTVSSASTSDFDNWIELSIDHSQVQSTLTDFPVLVYIEDFSALDGYDEIDFTFFDSDDSTECNWELEDWDDVTDTLVAWVTLSSVSSSTDTPFYLYYDGDGDGGENNPTGTWDNDYLGVYHFDDSSGLSDSTSNNNDATNTWDSPTMQQTGDYWLDITDDL